VFNQFVPDDDCPIPPAKDDEEEDGDDEEESSNSLLRPLPRPLLMDIADRFVVMPIGANAVATHTMVARTSSSEVESVVVFILLMEWIGGGVENRVGLFCLRVSKMAIDY